MKPFNQILKLGVISILTLSAAFSLSNSAKAISISIYLSAPKSQTTIYSNTTVETFNSLVAGNRTTDYNSAIGIYHLSPTNPFNIQADNQYGSGTGNYVALGAQSGTSAPFTLTLTSPATYFGLSWNAGDNKNGLAFYSGNILVGQFISSSIQAKLSATTVTALDNTVYTSASYRGKPPAGTLNPSENYAFINFIATGGTFDSVVFSNSGSIGSGFESDNHTILGTPISPDGKFVFVSNISTVPEPGVLSVGLCSLIGIAGFSMRRRFRKKE